MAGRVDRQPDYRKSTASPSSSSPSPSFPSFPPSNSSKKVQENHNMAIPRQIDLWDHVLYPRDGGSRRSKYCTKTSHHTTISLDSFFATRVMPACLRVTGGNQKLTPLSQETTFSRSKQQHLLLCIDHATRPANERDASLCDRRKKKKSHRGGL